MALKKLLRTGAGPSFGGQRVLVVVAHPDDEILGCGGTMALHAASGDVVHLVVMGEGITSRDARRDPGRRRIPLTALQRDLRRAAQIVGVRTVQTYTFPDNRFDSVPLLDLVKAVETEKARVRPTIVYTHHPNDLNVDHGQVASAVQTAFRPLPGEAPVAILAMEVASSTEYQSSVLIDSFRPNVYVDIEATLDLKRRAMNAYRSEVRPYPHPRSARALEVIARRNGLEVGLGAAERFVLVRAVVTPALDRVQSRRAGKRR
jgi:LmbE family N-acetylglucosaminyl deacetylase